MNKHSSLWRWTMAAMLAMGIGSGTMASAAEPLNLVPYPASVKQESGPALKITADSRIIAQNTFENSSLQPLVAVVQNEIKLTSGLTLQSGEKGTAKAGDIVLEDELLNDFTPLTGEYYKLEVTDRVTIRGINYQSVAEGTATLLQMLDNAEPAADQSVELPRVSISDHSAHAYRGVMLDLARQHHTIDQIKEMVVLARLYKIRYMQLHLSDDQGFTFPSKAFPKLATPGHSYTLDELNGLEAFARDRGVTIIPEIDVPGHSSALNNAAPEIFGGRGPTINFGDQKAVEALGTIIGEILDVFKSTPYFHIGADEVIMDPVVSLPSFQARLKELGTTDNHEVFRWFIGQMNEQVKKHGRQTICWEGFPRGGKVKVPTDVIVMPFDCIYYDGPDKLLEDGYRVINASWTPLYVVNNHRWSPEQIYSWDLDTFGRFSKVYSKTKWLKVKPTDQILGGQMCAWEQPGSQELPSMRTRLPAMAERLWNPKTDQSESYAKRSAATDDVLTSVLSGLTVKMDGLSHPDWSGPGGNVPGWFTDKVQLSIKSNIPGAVVRYNTKEPLTAKSPVISEPFTVDSNQTVRAQAFDKEGKPLGMVWSYSFVRQPITVKITGLDEGSPTTELPSLNDVDSFAYFGDKATITLTSAAPDSTIRYTLDGSQPNPQSKEATGTIDINDSCAFVAQVFDKDNRALGQKWGRRFQRTKGLPNLTLNKPITASSTGNDGTPEYVVDGLVDLDHYWGAYPAPQWVQVDLENAHTIDRIILYTYWDNRFYQYKIDVSMDAKTWTTVIDRSKNTTVATPLGYEDKFAPTQARYIRVTMLKNSANPAVHIVELRAFED